MGLRHRKQSRETEEDKTIEISAQMQGSLVFKDPIDLKINGNFDGSLEARGTVTIGETSSVEADVSADNIVIAGKITGNIKASKMLVLMPTAVLKGDISTPKLNIVEGAIFHGNCQMVDDLLGIDEVSRYLEIDINEIEELAKSGRIPGLKKGEDWKFERNQIDNWASSGKLK